MAEAHCQRRVQGHLGYRGLTAASHPVGVFDSGLGGLSILQALRAELPAEDFVYVADSGHAPYGERDPAHVIERSLAITRYLLDKHHIKALVVACNTATAAVTHLLRERYPQLPIVGVEPALKPAAQLSQTGRIGVMATRGTLESSKFNALLTSLQDQAEFILQPCDGLADAIEHQDVPKIEALCERYTKAIGEFGLNPGEIDTLVLGCTHYPFASARLRTRVGPEVRLLETGSPVARQTRRLLHDRDLLQEGGTPHHRFYATAHPERLQAAVRDWLHLESRAELLTI